jgi:hypothetical protein
MSFALTADAVAAQNFYRMGQPLPSLRILTKMRFR